MIVPDTGIRSFDYVSYAFGRFHPWFVALGYPRLDIEEYEDGSWSIVEWLTMPIVPALTQHRIVLQNITYTEKTFGFCKKHCQALDTSRREFWDREEAATKAVEHEDVKREEHAQESAGLAANAIIKNPDLMNRIAKKGLREMDIDVIRGHIPNSKF